MNIEVDTVRAWLIDEGNVEAAALLSEAEFDYVYVDMAMRLDADEEFEIYELIIKIPPRIYRNLGTTYKKLSEQIEAAYNELQQHVRGEYARSISWSAKLPSIEEVEASPEMGRLFEDSTLADVQRLWTKAKARLRNDPDGAITAAKTMLEAACKAIIKRHQGIYTSNDDLPKLFKEATNVLGIASNSSVSEEYRKLAGACSTIVNAISCIRNRTSDAHFVSECGDMTHASLVVNVSGSIVSYLVSIAPASPITRITSEKA